MTLIENPFRAFTVTGNGLCDKVITDIGVTQGAKPDEDQAKVLHVHQTRALWDTGATKSVISPAVVKELGLQPVGMVKIKGATGDGNCRVFVVNFRLPNKTTVYGVMAAECDLDGFDVLIGMDVIVLGDLSLSHKDGKSMFSFRMPSIEGRDFVAEHKSWMRAHIGRNDDCPCGKKRPNGRAMKFKDCCGK